MIEFIAANYAAIILVLALLFVGGIFLWIVGALINRRYTKKLHRIERNMTPEQWEDWAYERGYPKYR